MSFLGYVLQSRHDNKKALVLFIVLAAFYIVMDFPYLTYMKDNAEQLAAHNPFYGAPFSLNLFNFDPSMYYGYNNISIIHPLINFLAGSLNYIAGHWGGNLFFLVLQSAINALSSVLIYYYLRGSEAGNWLAMLFAVFFGISSYNLFTAMIPDSYPYVQFMLIWSVLYFQYTRESSQPTIRTGSYASLAFVNFALTSTNIVPLTGAMLFNGITRRDKRTYRAFGAVVIWALVLVIVFTGLQWLVFDGSSWATNWSNTLDAGGFSYVAPFSFSHHWQAFYMLGVSPVLTPDVTMIDTGIVAVVTDLAQSYPFYVHIIGIGVLLLALLGFIQGFRTREAWVLASFIIFGLLLHIVVGFGLAAFKYDMYLYAGHFLFAIFLLAARFINQMYPGIAKTALLGIILLFTLVTLGNNIMKHSEALDHIKQSYAELKQEQTNAAAQAD
ncbi:DUF6080 domain-containing protein [Paenibacillus sp. GCM10027626]|uniref:DUF6080 domain-containing protein n=1 Tax=Paenibacillus sp. GCM10027626 TaxID=3273411 RepID=UPI00363C0788